MSTLIAAVIFIVTSGGLFKNKFKNHLYLQVVAACVALLSAYYLIGSLSEDVKGFFNRGTAITQTLDTLETPEPRPIPVSDFGYKVVDRGSKIDFVFPYQVLGEISSLSNDAELGSTGFNVDISERLSVSCTHWVTQGAGELSNYGLTSVFELLPKLKCNAWSDDGNGSANYVPDIGVTVRYVESDAEIVVTLESSGVFRLERSRYDRPCIFIVQNQWLEYIRQQNVKC